MQTVGRWQDIRPKLYNRPGGSPQTFGTSGPFTIRPEDNWYGPPANLRDRTELVERFGLKPFIIRTAVTFSANVALAEMQAYVQANKSFEVTGASASSDDVTFTGEGGIRLESDAGAADSIIVQSITGATGCPNPSAWGNTTWGSDQETWWGCTLATTATISATTYYAGLKLTNTNVVATDANQAFFRAEAGQWTFHYSIGGVDSSSTTNCPAVAASTKYEFKIIIDEARHAHAYVNGNKVIETAALTDAIDLVPFVGLINGGAAAKSMHLYNQWISRNIA